MVTKSLGSRVRFSWVYSALLPTEWVSWRNLLNLPKPLFPHL